MPNAEAACFAVLALVAVVSIMIFILKRAVWLYVPTPPSTPDVGAEETQVSGVCQQLGRRRHVRRLSELVHAVLAAGKRSGRQVAVILDRVPSGLYAADVGFVFTDVVGNGP